MNAEAAEADTRIETGTGVGQDGGVILAIEDGLRQEAEDQAAVIQGTLTEEKEDVLVAKREATSGLTAQVTLVVEEILDSSIEEEMTVCLPTVDMDLEMGRAEESPQEVDHPHL